MQVAPWCMVELLNDDLETLFGLVGLRPVCEKQLQPKELSCNIVLLNCRKNSLKLTVKELMYCRPSVCNITES